MGRTFKEDEIIWHPCGNCITYGNINCMKNKEDCEYAEEGEIIYGK